MSSDLRHKMSTGFFRYWPFIVRIGSFLAFVMAVAVAIVGVVMYATADSRVPELDEGVYAPGEVIDVPNAYSFDGIVMWGKPANVDLSEVECQAIFINRDSKLAAGPREVDEDLAVYDDQTHGEVAYLASTAPLILQPRSVTCSGTGLEQVLISPDRDVEGVKSDGRFFMTNSVMLLLFGIALRWHLRWLNSSSTGRTSK